MKGYLGVFEIEGCGRESLPIYRGPTLRRLSTLRTANRVSASRKRSVKHSQFLLVMRPNRLKEIHPSVNSFVGGDKTRSG